MGSAINRVALSHRHHMLIWWWLVYLFTWLIAYWKFYQDTGQGEWRQNSRGCCTEIHRFLLKHWNLHKYFSHFGEGFFMSLGKGEWMSHNQLQPQLSFLPYQVQLKTVWLYSLQGHHICSIVLNWGRQTFEHKKQRLRSVHMKLPQWQQAKLCLNLLEPRALGHL